MTALSVFERERRRLEAGLMGGAADLVDQVGTLELARRQIDAQPE